MHPLSVLAIMAFIIGSALHTLAQVDAIARAKRGSRQAIFLDRWPTVLIRTVLSTAIFVLWLQGQLVDTLTAIKVPLPGIVIAVLDLHVGSAIAIIAGIASDSVLGYIPGLATTLGIPPPIDATVTNLPAISLPPPAGQAPGSLSNGPSPGPGKP